MARIFNSFSQFFGDENYDSSRYAKEYEKRRLLMTHLLNEGASIPAVMNFCWNESDRDLPAGEKLDMPIIFMDPILYKEMDKFIHSDPESPSPDDDYWCHFGTCIERLVKMNISAYGLYNAIIEMERRYEEE